jgi:hypothetical protein
VPALERLVHLPDKLAGVYSFISLNSNTNPVLLPIDYADGGKNFSIHRAAAL